MPRAEPFHPPTTIYITVTNARRHLFELFDLIGDYDLDCILIHKGKPAATIVYDGPASDSPQVAISPGLPQAITRASKTTAKEVVCGWRKRSSR
jgi:hypothetical protein